MPNPTGLAVIDGNDSNLSIETKDGNGNLLIHGDELKEFIRDSTGAKIPDEWNVNGITKDALANFKLAVLMAYFEADRLGTGLPVFAGSPTEQIVLLGIAASEVN